MLTIKSQNNGWRPMEAMNNSLRSCCLVDLFEFAKYSAAALFKLGRVKQAAGRLIAAIPTLPNIDKRQYHRDDEQQQRVTIFGSKRLSMKSRSATLSALSMCDAISACGKIFTTINRDRTWVDFDSADGKPRRYPLGHQTIV